MKKKTPKKRVLKRRPVKPINPVYNMSHPEIAHKVELAFKAGGRSFYRFIDDHQIPAGRYKYIYAALREVDLRMSLETLKGFVAEIRKILNGGDKKNSISLEGIWKVVWNMESRLDLAFEPASVARLSAVIFFEETEDLMTYDKQKGAEKVAFWEKNNVKDFFLTMPIVELLGLRNISATSLESYIQDSQALLQDLTFDLQSPSSESSSEIGKSPS